MQIDYEPNSSPYVIRSYQPGTLQVADEVYHENVVLTSNELPCPWLIHDIRMLKVLEMKMLCDRDPPEILVIGTGHQFQPIPPDCLSMCYQLGVGLEVMTTQSACSTYNLLLNDQRKVMAALVV